MSSIEVLHDDQVCRSATESIQIIKRVDIVQVKLRVKASFPHSCKNHSSHTGVVDWGQRILFVLFVLEKMTLIEEVTQNERLTANR